MNDQYPTPVMVVATVALIAVITVPALAMVGFILGAACLMGWIVWLSGNRFGLWKKDDDA